jgi:hypothetical protein
MNAVEAPLAVVPAPIIDEVAEIVEELAAETPVAQSPAAQQEVVTPKSPVKSPVKSTKVKKSPTLSGGIVYGGPAATEAVTTPDSSVAPALQQDSNTAVATPADQPAVEQQPATADTVTPAPAAAQPSESGDVAAAQEPVAEQQPATTSANTSTKTSSNFPKFSGTPNIVSQFQGATAADLTAPKISIPCIPGYTC